MNVQYKELVPIDPDDPELMREIEASLERLMHEISAHMLAGWQALQEGGAE